MQKFKTADGEGLRMMIESNLPNIGNERVKEEIINLLKEVLPNARVQDFRADDRTTAQAI